MLGLLCRKIIGRLFGLLYCLMWSVCSVLIVSVWMVNGVILGYSVCMGSVWMMERVEVIWLVVCLLCFILCV